MDKVAIITPIVLQTEAMLNIYLSNLASYNPMPNTKVYLMFNRLNMDLETIRAKLKLANYKLDYELVNDGERSVAGAWNYGIHRAIIDGAKVFHIIAADVALNPNVIPILYQEITSGKYDLISSLDFQACYGRTGVVQACDFSSFMINTSTLEKYGWFDREYKPAYFEDNDYTTRIFLSGNLIYASYDAVHYHYGSATIKVDAEMAHHVKHWFNINAARYAKKWGGGVTNDINYMRNAFFKKPYNSNRDYGWWPEQERSGYSLWGRIHE